MPNTQAIYTVPGIAGRFIFCITGASNGSRDWEVEVVSLPFIPVMANAPLHNSQLLIEECNGKYLLAAGTLGTGVNYPGLEQLLLDYCHAYAKHLKTGLPVKTFL